MPTTPVLRPPGRLPAWRLSPLLLLAAALAACGGGGAGGAGPAAAGKPGGPGAAPPPPAVGVVTVAPVTTSLVNELPGRVEASRTAQVRARVTGIVQRRLFTEGSEVRAGQALFQIDPAPYQAAVDSARATLARAQATAAQATSQVNRFRPLREANAISEQDFSTAQAAQATAEADVAAAQAALRTAQLNLGYATVTAPIAGRIGRALVTEGALVSAAEATQLALIQQIDPVFVNATQPVAELARLRAQVGADAAGSGPVPVSVVLDDGSVLPQKGRLLFSDLSVDATTGQVLLRTEVANPGLKLLPGMYVRTRLAQGRIEGAMRVPQQAVTRGDTADTVLVVGADNVPAPRPVKIAGAAGSDWIVTSGLQAGDRVIVEGFQKMRGNGPVTPVPWAPAGVPPASAPPGATAASAPASAPAPAAPASR